VTPGGVTDFGGLVFENLSGQIQLGSLNLNGCPTPYYVLEGPTQIVFDYNT